MEDGYDRPAKRQKHESGPAPGPPGAGAGAAGPGESMSPDPPSSTRYTPVKSTQSSIPPEDRQTPSGGPEKNPGVASGSAGKSDAGSESPAAPLLYKQPACQRCRSKKIKCDALSPQCTACKRANEACTISNPTSHQEYHRGYVESLEDRVQQLQSYMQSISRVTSMDDVLLHDDTLLDDNPPPSAGANGTKSTPTRPGFSRKDLLDSGIIPKGPGIQRIQSKEKDDREARYLGEGSGIGFINSILAAIRTRHSDINLLRSLLSSKKKPTSTKSTSKQTFSQTRSLPPTPPPTDLGETLLNTYLEKAQPKHPFIARSEIVRVCEALLGISKPPHPLSSQDHFRAYMVFAIASVWHFRQGDKDSVNPMKFYANAMFYIDGIPRLHGVDGVTNLLFIARLGFFCTTGLSLWYISNLCLRICVENEMHLNPPRSKYTPTMPAFEEQIRRRLFWQCYSLDRHASQTLGRPFGIADEDIQISLPEDVDDEKLIGVAEDLPTFMSRYVPAPTSAGETPRSELAFFIHNIKLKKITSRMNVTLFGKFLHSPSDPVAAVLTPGKMYTFFEEFVVELENWRASAPTTLPNVAVPMSKAYVSQDWFDLHFYQEKLTLVRAIIDLIPRPTGHPPSDLLEFCFETATRIIKLYQKDSAMGDIEPARGRLYRVFVAGISVLYCLLLTQQRAKDEQSKIILPSIQGGAAGRAGQDEYLLEQKEMLRTCQRTLELMAKPLIDDGSGLKYVRTFEVLCREVLRRVNQEAASANANANGGSKDSLDANGIPKSPSLKRRAPGHQPQQHPHHTHQPEKGATTPPNGEKMSRRQSRTGMDEGMVGEFGGASPPSGYEKIHPMNSGSYGGTPNDNSPHSGSQLSWPGMSEFAAGEIGEWFSGGEFAAAVNNGGNAGSGFAGQTGGVGVTGSGGGASGGTGGMDWDLTGGGSVSVENGVTGGYDYQWEGLGAEWAGFLEILMDGKAN